MFILFALLFTAAIFGIVIFSRLHANVANKQHYDGSFRTGRFVAIGFAVVFGLLMISKTITVIDPGKVGVVTLFGSVSETQLDNGIHIINPMCSVQNMDVRTQAYTMSHKANEGNVQGDDGLSLITSDGLTISNVEVTVQFRLMPSEAVKIYKNVGMDYVNVIVRPEIRSSMRNVSSGFSFEDLYKNRRAQFAILVKSNLDSLFKVRGIICENVLLRNLEAPPEVQRSIQEKMQMAQEAQKMEFVLQKEKMEADRKRVEAQGIADFQRIVSAGISDQLLKWRGIDATEKLARSPNTKIVVIGGKDGMPLILNN